MENTTIKPLTKTELKQAQKIAEEFFEKLEVKADVRVEPKDEMLDVLLETEETGILIGYHGETLESLQVLLSLAISQKLGRFVRAMVDVGDYRKNRTEYLERLVEQVKERALRENREQVITSLKSWERRVVHMLLQADEEVLTESQGAGRDRVLVVRPK